MSNNFTKLTVRQFNKDRLMNECKLEFIRNFPNMKNAKFTEDFLLSQVIEYFLEKNILKL
jgi:hypothetical protein